MAATSQNLTATLIFAKDKNLEMIIGRDKKIKILQLIADCNFLLFAPFGFFVIKLHRWPAVRKRLICAFIPGINQHQTTVNC